MAKHWPYSEAFDRRYREYRDRTKASNEDVADALGVSPFTVNSYRRKRDAIKPDDTALLKAAKLFGCSIFEFMPNYQAIESSGVDVAGLNDMDIYRISESARMVTDPAATQEEKDLMIQGMRELRAKAESLKRAISGTNR